MLIILVFSQIWYVYHQDDSICKDKKKIENKTSTLMNYMIIVWYH